MSSIPIWPVAPVMRTRGGDALSVLLHRENRDQTRDPRMPESWAQRDTRDFMLGRCSGKLRKLHAVTP